MLYIYIYIYVCTGVTECVHNTLDPQWRKTFALSYFGGSEQELKIKIYNVNSDNSNLNTSQSLGNNPKTLIDLIDPDNHFIYTTLRNIHTYDNPGNPDNPDRSSRAAYIPDHAGRGGLRSCTAIGRTNGH